MSKFSFIIIAFLVFNINIEAQTKISIDSISTHIGQTIKVCDKVAGTFVTKSDKLLTYLNQGADFPNVKLTIVIFHKDLANFPLAPSDHYKDMNICITGELTVYKDRPQIIANKPDQIEIK